MLKLKQRLETSDKEEDKQTVQALQKVLNEIDALKVDQKFADVNAIISDAKKLTNAANAKAAADENSELHEAMLKLLAILDNIDDADAGKHDKIAANQKLLEKLKESLSSQERLIAKIERGQKDSKDMAKSEDRHQR